jgi:ligand-binding sensor domain-containing protein
MTGMTGSTEVPITGAAKARTAVAALAVADGTLWAGTAAGLYRLAHGKLERVTLEPGVPADVTALHAAGKQLWIATTAGLYLRDGGHEGKRDGQHDGATIEHFSGGDLRRVTRVDGAIVAAGLGTGVVRVDRGRLAPLAGIPRELVMAQAIAERGGAACAGGLDGLWLRANAAAPWVAAAKHAGPPSNDVSALAVQSDRLWVGTFDQGLAVLDHGAWRRITDRAIDPRINALLVDHAQRLWVATSAGLSMIDRDRTTQLTIRDGLPSRSVLALTELHDGRILIGTTSGAAIIGEGRPIALGAKQNIEAKNVWAVAEDGDGWIWLGTTTGLFRGRADDATWMRFSVATGHLRDDWVMALALRDHSVWVGTYHGGVARLDDAGSDAPTAAALGDGWINPGGLRWIGDTLYASTMEGLRTGDGASPTWTAMTGLPGRDTTSAVRGGDTLWIATRRGLVATR